MIPCSSCLLERSCYWSRARWQPFVCRHPHYSPAELQQCLLHRKVCSAYTKFEIRFDCNFIKIYYQLIFVGDSTNRGMMESLLERLDGWLTTSDRYCVVSIVYTLFSSGVVAISSSLLSYCPPPSPWLIGRFYYFVFLFSFLCVPGQSGTVIATVLPTLAGRHNSTLTIIPNSGCRRGLRSSRRSPTCSEGNIEHYRTQIPELYPLRPVCRDQ